ncbi:tetratricopeptide repeat protein [uncultured Kriegella sp.]|uniref:tetratricopeptide repeat protein n=1 Tax=uncultured Kriegella sp. TaxID=1798910 RepID=UPI0030DBF277|tara:strand:+ start:50617 stop:51354 length:738 start_codon:yes stop_codon:yes gene_type:complete
MDKELLLYRYFSNQLTEQENIQLQELLKTDGDFKQQFDFQNNLKQVINDKENKELKAKLVTFENAFSQEKPARTFSRPYYSKWAMAASIVLFVGLGWVAFNNFFGTNYEELYENNFQQYPNTVYSITRGESVKSIEGDAFMAYEAGSFHKALEGFQKISEEERNDYVDFYMGQSCLQLNQLEKSKVHFQKVIDNTGEFAAESHWYLALIAIKQESKEKAKQQLNELISKYDYNKDKATELLFELD